MMPQNLKDLPLFGGTTYSKTRDGARLNMQLSRVRNLMLDGCWRSLSEIAQVLGYPEASISARLRDLRKAPHGGYDVQRKNAGGGTWLYRVSGKKAA